jgi:hypothetical protein
MTKQFYGIVTTVQRPTPAICELAERLENIDGTLVVVGDKKGPENFDIAGTDFLSLKEQLASSFKLARNLPVDHYARKNIGYLHAISQGARCIYETDDDNTPLVGWNPRSKKLNVKVVEDKRQWANVYSLFSDKRIWPRGFPLDCITDSFTMPIKVSEKPETVSAPIQQGLADNSPDVDAVWRLVLDQSFEFDPGPSVMLPEGVWCPFNSQSTWWWPEAYSLMYLPSYCTFRMTDIWRSFIAQRCLWELDFGIVFHAPEVIQDRNAHNLMKDFEDEIPGYTGNKKIVNVLEGLILGKGREDVENNLLKCYEVLVKEEVFPENELVLVETWLEDLGKVSEG